MRLNANLSFCIPIYQRKLYKCLQWKCQKFLSATCRLILNEKNDINCLLYQPHLLRTYMHFQCIYFCRQNRFVPFVISCFITMNSQYLHLFQALFCFCFAIEPMSTIYTCMANKNDFHNLVLSSALNKVPKMTNSIKIALLYTKQAYSQLPNAFHCIHSIRNMSCTLTRNKPLTNI